jgi:hypothetical protein
MAVQPSSGGSALRRTSLYLLVAVVAVAVFQSAASAQALPLPVPTLGSLAAMIRCLTGEGCAQRPVGIELAPPSVCAANASTSNCAQAVGVLAPLRDQLRDAYESAKPASLADKFVNSATDYVNAYFTHGLSKSGVVVPPDTLTRGLWRKGCDAES